MHKGQNTGGKYERLVEALHSRGIMINASFVFGLDEDLSHYNTAHVVFEPANMTAKELCDICDEDKSAISRSIDYLEKNEYIMCTSKTEKRYKSPLFLTEKGKAVGIEIVKKIDNFLNEASEGISEENRDNLYKSLAVISNNLQKICEKLGEKYD